MFVWLCVPFLVSLCFILVLFSLALWSSHLVTTKLIALLPRPGVCGGGGWEGSPISGQYGRPKALPPHFSAWAAPKDFTFSTSTAPKDTTFHKYTFVCSTFFRPGLLQKTPPPFKDIRFFVIFSSKFPLFFSEQPLWKPHPPPFSVRALLKPPPPSLSDSERHMYTTFIYEYPPPPLPGLPSTFSGFTFVYDSTWCRKRAAIFDCSASWRCLHLLLGTISW